MCFFLLFFLAKYCLIKLSRSSYCLVFNRLTDPNVGYEELVKEARENLTRETKKVTRPMSGVSAQRDEVC